MMLRSDTALRDEGLCLFLLATHRLSELFRDGVAQDEDACRSRFEVLRRWQLTRIHLIAVGEPAAQGFRRRRWSDADRGRFLAQAKRNRKRNGCVGKEHCRRRCERRRAHASAATQWGS
jgi:hypothetical protein